MTINLKGKNWRKKKKTQKTTTPRWTKKQKQKKTTQYPCQDLWASTCHSLDSHLRPETRACEENDKWVSLSKQTRCGVSQLRSLWLGYGFQLPPHSDSRILPSPWVTGGITPTVIVWLWWHAYAYIHTHSFKYSCKCPLPCILNEGSGSI